MNKKNDLYILQEQASNKINIEDGYRVLVGMGTCGISSGAKAVLDAINKQVADKGLTNVKVLPTGCIGMCVYEPIVEIFAPGKEKISYTHVDPEKAVEIVENHLIKGEPLGKYTVEYDGNGQIKNLNDIQFYQKQKRVVLKNCGSINPEDIDEYIAQDGYKAVHKALTEMTPQEVIDTITASGLRGRGGAGFPTGKKWGFAAANKADQKYIVCNADEGDPGAFMDRSILEGDPHSILEAMIIGGYSFGATKGFIYVRAEYPVAVKRLQIAIDQAKALGFQQEKYLG